MQISKTSKGKKKQHVISLPKEVVVEILQRVACLDLHENLKKVCMDWCWIIYSGSFAYSHIERRILKSSSSFSEWEAVVITRTDDMRSLTVSFLDWHSIPSYPPEQDWYTEHLYTFEDALGIVPYGRVYTMRVNSVNGLVCFWTSDGRIHICNPITAEYVTTPAYEFILNAPFQRPTAFGFGFCQLLYKYKVVLLEDILHGEIKPSVLTIGTDRTWRSLKAIPDRRVVRGVDTGVYVNGVIYWYAVTCTDWQQESFRTEIENLICFDVTNEVVHIIDLPIESLDYESGNCIAEKGGKLCWINISNGPMYSLLIQLYCFDDGADHLSCLNSWKKEFNVTVPNLAYHIDVSRLFVLIVTDDILVIRLGDEYYGFFDVATGMLLGVYHVNYSEAIVSYVPSLVHLRHRPPLPSVC